MAKPRVLYDAALPPDVREIVSSQVPEAFDFCSLESGSPEERFAKLQDADYLLASGYSVTEEVLAAAPRLKLVQLQGVGYDNIDVAAATRMGIPVAQTPEGTSVGVAEHTILLILALYKQLIRVHQSVKEGRWLNMALRAESHELKGKQVGLVGFGRIGQEVAKRILAFDARVVYYDMVLASTEVEERFQTRRVPLEELLRTSDIVSLHIPRTQETVGLLKERELGLMKPTAILINTARGGIVEEDALYRALLGRRIAGAALDAYEKEPPDKDNPLFSLENVVLTPHLAAGTRDAMITKMQAAFANMLRVHQGEAPIHRI